MAKENIKQETKEEASLVRILGKDIRGDKKVLAGLTKITGISWAFANAICKKLNLDEKMRIQEIPKDKIKKIEEFIENPDVPTFLKNRQKDFDSGENKHLSGEDLRLRKEFDIKRLRKTKSYKGVRHSAGLPVRGQRTRSNFRKNRRKSGVTGVKKK